MEKKKFLGIKKMLDKDEMKKIKGGSTVTGCLSNGEFTTNPNMCCNSFVPEGGYPSMPGNYGYCY
ncbi:MAG TPA: hypothetical protein VIJ95_16270 [Hanamia sp.]